MIGSMDSREGVTDRIAELNRLLAIREDRPGFGSNVAEIRVLIANAEAKLAEFPEDE
jgi:hypothetical protein